MKFTSWLCIGCEVLLRENQLISPNFRVGRCSRGHAPSSARGSRGRLQAAPDFGSYRPVCKNATADRRRCRHLNGIPTILNNTVLALCGRSAHRPQRSGKIQSGITPLGQAPSFVPPMAMHHHPPALG